VRGSLSSLRWEGRFARLQADHSVLQLLLNLLEVAEVTLHAAVFRKELTADLMNFLNDGIFGHCVPQESVFRLQCSFRWRTLALFSG